MIDIEFDVFDYVAAKLRESDLGIFVSGQYVDTPASFPAVTIVESVNSVVQRMRTTTIENAARLMYEVNIYSNKAAGKKREARAVAALVDDAFTELGFTRTFLNQVPNLMDASIYRIVLRYTGVAIPNDDGKIYIHRT